MIYQPVKVILDMEQMEERLAYWQKQLRLQDWVVEVKFERGYELGENIARIRPYSHNKRAVISMMAPGDYSPHEILPYDMERILLHELLHLHFWPLTKDDGENDAEEQAINAIAEALLSLERRRQAAENRCEAVANRLYG
jgi:hypothetical protein